MTPVRIAVIEDDKDDFVLISSFLPASMFQLEWIPSYQTGLQALQKQDYDLYLIDYFLGEKSGLEMVSELGDSLLKKPMILMTGVESHALNVTAMERGISNFLPKQKISAELLERSIRYCLKKSTDLEKVQKFERQQADQETQRATLEVKSQFLDHLSHEIRTPISAILGFVDLALNSDDPKQRGEFLNVIKRNGEQLLDLINDWLDLSKIESGKFPLRTKECDWLKIVEGVVELFSATTKKKGVDLAIETRSLDLPRLVMLDGLRFRQILINVLGNAVKFTEKGKIVVKCQILHEKDQAILSVRVEDTGPGIEPKFREVIFEEFEQGRNHRVQGGTGLGLCLSRRLARLMSGDLILQSSNEKGSQFQITVPIEIKSRSNFQPKVLIATL